MATENDNSFDRRQFLRRAAVTGAAAAWATPIVQTVVAGPASAQTPVTPVCEHSPDGDIPDVPGENCMSTCQAACGAGTGGECADICNPNCARGVCPAQFCNPACYQCCNGEPIFICDPLFQTCPDAEAATVTGTSDVTGTSTSEVTTTTAVPSTTTTTTTTVPSTTTTTTVPGG